MFAIALTLLALSAEVPHTWTELVAALREIPAFLACGAIFLWIWYEHYRFHRRFGLEDGATTFLNLVLILVMLVYVFPLKYVLSPLIASAFGWADAPADAWGPPGSGARLMLFYSGGFVVIFGLLLAMYLRAWRLRERLQLDAAERLIARATMGAHGTSMGVGLVSIALALVGGALAPFSGLVFFLLGPLHGVHGWRSGARLARLRAAAGPP